MSNKNTVRSIFAVWNNPRVDYIYKHDEYTGSVVYEDGKPVILDEKPTIFSSMTDDNEICKTLVEMWCATKPGRTAACTYCVSADGLHHLHFILECGSDDNFRYSTVQKLYNQKMHIEITRGDKKQAEDYINKWGKYEEKGEIVLAKYQSGEIQGAQGQRRDINQYGQMILEGRTPREIMKEFFASRKYEKMLKDAFYDYRNDRTPYKRDVEVIWHVGETGTGKSYEVECYAAEHPDEVYVVSDYQNGGFDGYNGEPVLCLEEYRGQFPYNTLLIILDKYKRQVHSRYTNITGLWTTIHITSPLFPDEVYNKMVSDDNDALEQLLRRITYIDYHHKKFGKHYKYRLENPLENYKTPCKLKVAAYDDYNGPQSHTICTDNDSSEILSKTPIELREEKKKAIV